MSDAPIVETRDEVTYYRASALGGCPRALVAARQSYEAVPRTKPYLPFERGHEAELMAVARLREDGYEVYGRQLECGLWLDATHRIVGHVDGQIRGNGHKPHVLEIKSHTDAGIPDTRMEQYKWQIACYMLGYKLPLMLVRWNVDTSRYMITVYTTPPYSLQEIKDRVLDIETYPHPAEASCTNNYPCPYFYLHDIPDLVHDPALSELAVAYLGARQTLKEAQQGVDYAKEQLEKLAAESKKVVLDTGIVVNRYEGVRTTYDHKAMERDGIDIAPYRKPTTYQSLRVYTVDEDE